MALYWTKNRSTGDLEADAPEGTYHIEPNATPGPRRRYDLYLTHSGHVATGFSRAHMGWFGSIHKAKSRAADHHRNVIFD